MTIMELCHYKEASTVENKTSFEKDDDIDSWKPFLRQLLVCSCSWVGFFTLGLSVGAPTVIIPHVRREANSTDAVSDEMTSWLSSVHGYAAIPWIIILPTLSGRIGKKYSFMAVNVCGLASFVLFYCSTTLSHVLISEVIQGVISGCDITIAVIIISEYTSPKYRGIFLTLKSANFAWGMWVANAVGTFLHWKDIGLIGIVFTGCNIVGIFFWPESPLWLASKGRFDECEESHRWLKGTGRDSEKELDALISSHRNYLKSDSANSLGFKASFVQFLNIISSRSFYKPILICLVLLSLYHFCGKLVCSIYAIDIIKKITSTEKTAYTGMLILDGITLIGMYFGCFLSKFLGRRTLLLSTSAIGIAFLYIISLYLYLVKIAVIAESRYVSISLLMMFSLAISGGPMIMLTSSYAELIPIRYRSFSTCFTGLFSHTLMATILKISPKIFKSFTISGAFLFYGVTSMLCTILLYKYLPETKDKTLQEIEDVLLKRTTVDDNEFVQVRPHTVKTI